LTIYGTKEWGAKTIDTSSLPQKRARGIVIHHSAGANRPFWPDDAQFERDKGFQEARDIQRFHTAPPSVGGRGWKDTGYHFIITRGGIVMEGRTGSLALAKQGMVLYGAHAGNTEANAYHWGVSLEGDYEVVSPPPGQLRAAAELCAQLSLWGGTQATAITGHRDWKATACPGECLYRKLEAFRETVRTRKLALQGVK
jgi:hypothetical protein